MEAAPIVLRAFRRKYIPFSPRPIREPKVLYVVWLAHVPEVYTSWKDGQPHTIGMRIDFKLFKIQKKAEAYVDQQVTLGETPLSLPRCGPVHGQPCLAGGVRRVGILPYSRLSSPCLAPGVQWSLNATIRIESGPFVRPTTPVQSAFSTLPSSGFAPLMRPSPRPFAGV